jgi:hypothetical protein
MGTQENYRESIYYTAVYRNRLISTGGGAYTIELRQAQDGAAG